RPRAHGQPALRRARGAAPDRDRRSQRHRARRRRRAFAGVRYPPGRRARHVLASRSPVGRLPRRRRAGAAAADRPPRARGGADLHRPGDRRRGDGAARPGPGRAPVRSAAARGDRAGGADRGQRAAGHARRQAHRQHAALRRLRRSARAGRHPAPRPRVESGRGRGHGRPSRGPVAALHRPMSERPRSQTLGALLDEITAARPDAEAVVFRGERLTYAALRARVDTLARRLLALGVKRGDRVALLLPNRPEWLIGAFAAAKTGATVVAISTFSAPREIEWTLEHAQPRLIITMESFRGRQYLSAIHAVCPELASAAPGALNCARLSELRAVISIDERRHDGVVPWAALLEGTPAVNATALAGTHAAVTPEDVGFVLYTSGSTATPKGVMLTHGGVIANGFDIGERMHLTARDRVWLSAPLFWSFGSANALPALLTHGGSFV